MQNAIRSFPSYSTWDMFSNTVTYNTKIGVYIVQLLSQFLSCIQICYYEIISHTPDLPLIPNTHTHTCTLSLSLLGSLSILICYYHTQLKVNIPPFLVAQKRLIVTFVDTSFALTAYLEVFLLHHKELYWNSPCSILSDFLGGGGWRVTIKMKPVSAPDYFILLSIESRAVWIRHL